ncbi:MAG: hypothetical protein JW982_10300 [Spirochaetes bacterium]|nr:hypothetical protein [Spirochaetota bacterium]
MLAYRVRCYDSEYSILVFSAWRILKTGKIYSSWLEENKTNEKVFEFKNKKISRFELSEPLNDLILYFENDFIFQIFCDQIDSDRENYNLFTPEFIYSIESDSNINVEKRK